MSGGLAVAAAAFLLANVPSDRPDPLSAVPAAAHAAPTSRALKPGLREAVSATLGASQPRFHVQRTRAGVEATSGGLASTFTRDGVRVAARGYSVSFHVRGPRGGSRPSASGNRITYRRPGFEEWYVNGPLGLEQGFTFAQAPRGDALTVTQTLGGELTPRQAGQTILFGSSGATIRYSGLRAFDARGRALPARMRLAGRTLTLSVEAAEAHYPVTIDPLIQQGPKLVPSNGSGNGQFGLSVALSGDGNTALVGAPEETVGGVSSAGAAWIFTRSGTTWTQQARLLPSAFPEVGGGGFGSSVALSDDNGGTITALVGAPDDNSSVGAAWVFTGSGSSWSERQKLVPTTHAEVGPARFGTSLAISNAGTTALIGGPTDNSFVGAAWVFTGALADWSDHQKLAVTDEEGTGEFGSSVALSGDGSTALVGGPFDKGDDGAAWASTQSSGTFPKPTKLPLPTNLAQFAEFGTSVALSDDGRTGVIGGPYGSGGSAWIYTNSGGWTQSATLSPNDSTGSSLFGWSVAISGDAGTALVSGPDEGAAWVFKAPGWTQDGPKRTPGEQTFGDFGWSVAVSSDGNTGLFGEPFNAASNTEGAAWPFAAVTGNEVNTFDDALPSPTECSGKANDCSLRQAIDHAQPGDTIFVPPGEYTLTIPKASGGGALALSKSLTIKGEGSHSNAVLIEDAGGFDDRLIRVSGDSTDVTLTRLTLTGTTKGAIENVGGTLTLTEDTISDSSAAAGSAILSSGGRVFVGDAGDAGITVVRNDSPGGAIQLSGGSLTLSNSTIADNFTTGVYNTGGLATLTNVTLDRNFPASLHAEGSGVTHIRNTVIGGVGCNGTRPTTDGSNMDADGTCVVAGGGDSPNEPVDQYFAPLADNGGPTQTEALLNHPPGGSQNPGLDNGYPCPSVDQRGFSRSSECDEGAVAAFPPELATGFPTATTDAQPEFVGGTFAQVSGTINLAGEAGASFFKWGTSANDLGDATQLHGEGIVGAVTPVSAGLTGLLPAHTYYFQVVAENATGTAVGLVQSFTTPISDRYVDAKWAGKPQGTDPDGSGPATAMGTDAFATIGEAVRATNADETTTNPRINVAAGSYTESTLDLTKPGARLFGAGADSTHVTLSTLKVDANGAFVEGFDLIGPGLSTSSAPVVDVGPVLGVFVASNKISGGASGISFTTASDSEAASNELTGNLLAVVLRSGAANNAVINNDIHDNGNNSPAKIHPQASVLVDGATGTLVYGNTITNSVNYGISVRGSDTNVERNTISSSGTAYPLFQESAGIEINDGDGSYTVDNTFVSGNTITGSAFAGIRIGPTTVAHLTNTTIDGNTITGTLHGGANGTAGSGSSGPNSGGAAIVITQNGAAGLTITNNTLASNAGWGILQTNSSGNSSGNVANQNNITGNALGGVANRDSQSFDATDDWWGAADGPAGQGPGHGDTVSTNVLFDPWAKTAFQQQLPGNQLSGTAGQPVSGTLASGDGCPSAVTIFWGDGSPGESAKANCSSATESFTVSGTHTYADPGTYGILVQATGVGNFNALALISAPPPPNDNWANAALASGGSGSASGANDGATTESGEPLSLNGVTTGKTVWWKWTAPASGPVVFDTKGSSFDTVLGVFTGSSVSALSLVAADDDDGGGLTSQASFGAVAGTTYYLQIGSFGAGTTGSISLQWGPPPAVPANDDWASAAPLRSAPSGSGSGENSGATVEQGEPLQLTAATTGKTVWWKWVAPATGGFTFDTAGSSFDTVLGIFTGSSVSSLTEVASDDDGGGNGTSRASFQASAGTTYYVQVGSYAGGATGTIALQWTQQPVGPPGGPVVTNERTSGVDDVSATVIADIDPNGASTSYQIEYGTTSAYGQTRQSGVTSSTPFSTSDRIIGLQPSTTYHYRVDATNTAGTTNGPDATFTTGPQLSGTAGLQVSGLLASGKGCPANATINWDDGSSSAGTISCQGGAAPTFTVRGSHTYAAAGTYSIVVTVAGGATYGAGAVISPAQGTAAIAITKTPATQGVGSGGTATFTITVTNNGTVTLTNVTVTDPLSAACANTIGTLTAGQSTNYNCTQVNVTAAYTNVATVTGHPPTGPDVTASASADVTLNTPSGTPPIVTNEHTSAVDDVSATVVANIDPNGASTSYHIEYGTTTAYGQTLQSGVTSSTPFSTSDKLTGLQPSTTYHYRVVATNTAGTTNGPDATFTTGPRLSGTSGSQVSGTLASGTGCPTSATIDWGDGSPTNAGTINCQGAAAPTFTVSSSHTYAAAGTYSIVVTVSGGATYGAGALISPTGATPPSVSGQAAQSVTDTGATLLANVNPNGSATTYVIEYGTSSAYGQQTTPTSVGSGSTPVLVSQAFSGLASGTTYHFRFVATNTGGTTPGPDSSFTTAAPPPGAVPPSIVGEAAQDITQTDATVLATVNPNGSPTSYFVRYGTSTSYGQETAPIAIGADSTLLVVSASLTALAPGTTYHYQFVATNGVGTTFGADVTFATTAPPPPPPAPQEPGTTTTTTTTPTTTTPPPGAQGPQPPPPPVEGVSVDVLPLSGTVLVNGQPLQAGQQIPLGSIIDATHGTVVLQSFKDGVLQQMQFSGAVFQVFQLPDGTTQLVLQGGDFTVCKAFKPPTLPKAKAKTAKAKTAKKTVRHTSSALAQTAPVVRALWGNGQGSFQTKGRYAAATVRGTVYYVADRCDGTITRVERGIVSVHDDVLNKDVTVNAGGSYLAKAK